MLDNIDQFIAERIRKDREERLDLTQAAAAERCGIPLVTYQRAEDPTRSTSVGTLYKIASGFGRPIGWFFGEEKSITDPRQALQVIAEALDDIQARPAPRMLKSAESSVEEEILESIVTIVRRALPALDDAKLANAFLTLADRAKLKRPGS